VGLAKRLLERYEWWRFEPHPEWIEPRWSEEDFFGGYAAGIPGQVRVIYLPTYVWGGGQVKNLEPGVSYRAFLFNPADGEETDLGLVVPDAEGTWPLLTGADGVRRPLPIYQDWVLVLEAV